MFVCVCDEIIFPCQDNPLVSTSSNCSSVFAIANFISVTLSCEVPRKGLITPPPSTAVGHPLDLYDRQVMIIAFYKLSIYFHLVCLWVCFVYSDLVNNLLALDSFS